MATKQERLEEIARAKQENRKASAADESSFHAATSALNRWYWNEIRSLAIDLMERIESGELADEDAVTEDLEQTIDGHEFVIYTGKAMLALYCSENEDAVEDAGFENPTTEQRAYHAMIADVRRDLGVYGYTPMPDTGDDETEQDSATDANDWLASHCANCGADISPVYETCPCGHPIMEYTPETFEADRRLAIKNGFLTVEEEE